MNQDSEETLFCSNTHFNYHFFYLGFSNITTGLVLHSSNPPCSYYYLNWKWQWKYWNNLSLSNRMLCSLILAVFLVWATSSAHTTGRPCQCSALLPEGLRVNCSSLDLVELPTLPSDTTELHVQDNRLTSVSPGHFDRLVALKKVSLSGNPFHCDCRIQYLWCYASSFFCFCGAWD